MKIIIIVLVVIPSPLEKNDIFYENANIQNIIDIYFFDQSLRHILLKYIEKIEVKIKSIYAYEFVQLYTPLGHLESQNFCNDQIYHQVMAKVEVQKNKSLKHEAYIKHHVNYLQEPLPLWAYIDLFTIADISFIYSVSKNELQQNIASKLGLTFSKGGKLLGQFMRNMTILRNLCAHGSRLFNRVFEQKPSLNRTEKDLLIVDSYGNIDNAHLYGFIIVMRRLLNKEDFYDLKDDLLRLTDLFSFVSLKYYGFRDDWKEKL